MGPIRRLKSWWKRTTATEKLCMAVSGLATAASIVSICSNVAIRREVDNTKIEVKLYPRGKDDPDPIILDRADDSGKPTMEEIKTYSPAGDTKKTPYEQAKELYDELHAIGEELGNDVVVNDENNKELASLDEARQKALQIAWDLAASEDKLEDANEHLPYQEFD